MKSLIFTTEGLNSNPCVLIGLHL